MLVGVSGWCWVWGYLAELRQPRGPGKGEGGEHITQKGCGLVGVGGYVGACPPHCRLSSCQDLISHGDREN